VNSVFESGAERIGVPAFLVGFSDSHRGRTQYGDWFRHGSDHDTVCLTFVWGSTASITGSSQFPVDVSLPGATSTRCFPRQSPDIFGNKHAKMNYGINTGKRYRCRILGAARRRLVMTATEFVDSRFSGAR